jgi:hypothetical protein
VRLGHTVLTHVAMPQGTPDQMAPVGKKWRTNRSVANGGLSMWIEGSAGERSGSCFFHGHALIVERRGGNWKASWPSSD